MNRETALTAYSLMALSRGIDEQCKQLLAEGHPVPNYHSGTGQEATSVGIGLAAGAQDYLLYTYRDFGMLLAKGVDLKELVCDILLKAEGTTKGFGGIMHVVSPDQGIVGRNGVFGSRFGIAIGLALAAVHRGGHRIVVCAFGEAEASRGPLYEALNIACLKRLPVVFVAENNGFSISTRTEEMFASRTMSGMWTGAPLPVETVDGNDLAAVHRAATSAVAHCRSGQGPSFLECLTYRIDPHIPADDDSQYRSQDEVEQWMQRDPITLWKSRLIDLQLATEEEIATTRSEASARVSVAFEEALRAPEPRRGSVCEFVYYPKSGWRVRTGGGLHHE